MISVNRVQVARIVCQDYPCGAIGFNDSPQQSFATELTTDSRSHATIPGGPDTPDEQKFVCTPDYLVPKSNPGYEW